MSIAEQQRVRELEHKVGELAARVDEIERKVGKSLDSLLAATAQSGKTLTLPRKAAA